MCIETRRSVHVSETFFFLFLFYFLFSREGNLRKCLRVCFFLSGLLRRFFVKSVRLFPKIYSMFSKYLRV